MKKKKLLFPLLLVFGLLTGCRSEAAKEAAALKSLAEKSQLTVHEEEISVPGLKEEFHLDFLADTHISLCDERDADLMQKASQRYEGFRSPQGDGADITFQALMNYVKTDSPDLLVLGGDIIDSAMYASIDFVQQELEAANVPWLYSMGNHDFEYGSEYFSKTAYAEYLPRLKKISKTESGYQLMEYEDFLIFAADDKNNQISKNTLAGLKEALEIGKPILLVMHVPIEPLVENSLVEDSIQVWGPSDSGNSRVLIGEHACAPKETTQEFLDLVLAENSPVFLVLAGHIHFYHKDDLNGSLTQIVTGAGYQKDLVRLTLKPE